MSEPAWERLATQRQLDELCRSATDRVHEAIDGGEAASASDAVLTVLRARNGFVEVFAQWTGATLAWVMREHGEAAMAAALDAEEWLSLGLMTEVTPDEVALVRRLLAAPEEAAARIGALTRDGDVTAAKAQWERIEQAGLKAHDYRRDWATAVLAHVYRTFGVDGLNDALLYAAEQDWWTSWIDAELAAAPLERVAAWASHMTLANFGSISITEERERFVIHHRVCGSCGRQELQGRYEPPASLPRIAEPRPDVIFGHADDTLYRAHLPTLHHVSQIERLGYPWPAIECSGTPGRCWFFLYKDPSQTPARFFASVGLERSAAVVDSASAPT